MKTKLSLAISMALLTSAALTNQAISDELADISTFKSFDDAQLAELRNNFNKVETKSGMKNQYDTDLATTTFQWAAKNQLKPSITAIKPDQQVAYAADYYLGKLTGLSAAKSTLAQGVLTSTHDIGSGPIIAKYKQSIAGVEVFNREYNIMMDRELNLVASSGYFTSIPTIKNIAVAIKDMDTAFPEPASSISAAFQAMGGDPNSISLMAKPSSEQKYDVFEVTNLMTADKILVGKPRAKKVFYEHKNKLVAAYYVEIETGYIDTPDSEYYSYIISAETGEVLFKKNLINDAAEFEYRIYAEADGRPWDSPHGNVMPAPKGSDVDAYLTAEYLDAPLVSLNHGAISTMDPWLTDDATTTSGNNVNAYVDAIAPQGFTNGDYHAKTTSTNSFDYIYNIDEEEYSLNNRNAAIVNLFFVTNYLHDDYYDHGFDEASGNAQVVNYERGGVEADPLNVEVQDNSGFNNANMATPADGASPRMQMYIWKTALVENGVDYGLTVSSHPTIGLLDKIQYADFGAEVFNIKGNLVRIKDGTASITDGCQSTVNDTDVKGKIAIIDRGGCNFVVKVKNAQEAGAVAAIIVNNQDDGTPSPMGGSDDSITIPSMGISFSDGAAIYALLDTNETVSVEMFRNKFTFKLKDSSWDNAIVAHEWGHYISNRLVGNGAGLNSNQARSMGEGFSDFHALLFGSDTTDNLVAGNENYAGAYSAATYVASFVNGIRRFPYSTDMEINPSTFADVGKNAQVHASGSVFAVMLWDSLINLANDERHTFDEAKSLMKSYLVAAYKMMPIDPTFTEARDALLAAAYANNPEDYKLILAAFARRGMGLGAVSPSRYSTDHAGVVESYKTELSAFSVADYNINANYEGLTTGYCSNDNFLDKGETGTISYTLKNNGSEVLQGITGRVVAESSHDITFENDGVISFEDLPITGTTTSTPLEFTLNDAEIADKLILKFIPDEIDSFKGDEYLTPPHFINVDFKDRELIGTTQIEKLDTLSRLNDFFEDVIIGGEQAKGTFKMGQWTEADGLIFASANSFISDVAYETRPTNVGFDGEFTISFSHLYHLEKEYDGAVVEISINNDEWIDVTKVGGKFTKGGYSDTGLKDTEATAIANRKTFSGSNLGKVIINFGDALNGNQVKLRFRLATDSGFVPAPLAGVFPAGWYIDDLTLTNTTTTMFSDVIAGDTYPCDNRLPNVSIKASATEVKEGESVTFNATAVDANATDTLTYLWEQTSGTTVTLNSINTPELSFTAPLIASSSEELEFTLTVNDGMADVVTAVSVTVNYIPEKPKKRSSDGSSLSWLSWLLLPLAILRRRK